MTKRAILWCGHVREPVLKRDDWGRRRELTKEELDVRGLGDPTNATDDAKIQCNSLELAHGAALALGVARDEIHACVIRDDLLPQGFDPQQHHPATVDGLRRLVRRLAGRATAEDALLFIAVNHCDKTALATADPVDELDDASVFPRLTPEVLDECLRPLRGPQVLVMATCHAGIFLPLGEREGRAILASCGADDVYLVRREGSAWPAFLDELFGAWCGCALSDAVPRERLPLDEAFTRAERRLHADKAPNLPLRACGVVWPA